MDLWQKEFIKLLKVTIDTEKANDPQFSLRRFANSLEISPGALSELIREKRTMSVERAMRVLERVPAEPALKSNCVALMRQGPALPVPMEYIESIDGPAQPFLRQTQALISCTPEEAREITRSIQALIGDAMARGSRGPAEEQRLLNLSVFAVLLNRDDSK